VVPCFGACFNVLMRRFTATNLLTATTMLAGAATAVAAALGAPRAQGFALGAAVALGALLLRFVARDANRAGQRQAKSLESVSQKLDAVSERLAATKRKLDRRIEVLDKRVVRESSKMTLRILGDINAARLEQIDAAPATADHNG
jgi:hypothetical protein